MASSKKETHLNNESSFIDSEPPTPDAPMLSGTYSDDEGDSHIMPKGGVETKQRTPLGSKDTNIVNKSEGEKYSTPISAFRVTRSSAKKAR